MKRHKKLEGWSDRNAFDIGWELSKEIYDNAGKNNTRFGTVYEWTEDKKKKVSAGQLFKVHEGGKEIGVAMATAHLITHKKYWICQGRKNYTSRVVKKVMVLLNEEGWRKIQSQIIKAQL